MKINLHFREWNYRSLKKPLQIMRNALIILFLGVMQVKAIDTYSQGTRLTLNFSDTEIIKVLDKIESESEFVFLYNEKLLDTNRKISISEKDQLIKVILDDLFKGTDVKYTIIDRKIILAPEYLTKENSTKDLTQQLIITGTVTDSQTGDAMSGVNVVVKGTTIGAITDINGKYSLNVPDQNAALLFSFIGYDNVEEPVAGRTTINVALVSVSTAIEEIIVIGYGTQKKSDLTGSVSRISMDKGKTLASSSISQVISGSVAGINVAGTTGVAGSDPDISIRGQTSLSASGAPLIVLDGIIYNNSLNNININDIETIDVLKDASSAAVYGSRAANGVMLITTKKGTSQKPVISFNGYYGYQSQTNNPVKVMNGDQYAIRLTDYYYQQSLYSWYATKPTSDAGRPIYPDITNPAIVASKLRSQEERDNYLAGPQNEIDWIKEVTRVAPIQDYNLSMSGKGNNVNYFVSGSATNEKGIQKNDQFKRLTFRSNLESTVADWLKLGFNSSFSFRDYSGVAASLSNAISASPWANNHIGSPVYDIDLCQEYYMHYPFDDSYMTDSDLRNNQVLVGKAIITVPWIKGLTYELNFSSTVDRVNQNSFAPVTTRNGQSLNGYAKKYSYVENNWLLNNIITYNRTFNGDHMVNATFLYSRESRTANSTTAEASNFANDVLGYNNLGLGSLQKTSSTAWEENSISYMGRLNYVFKNRYMITGTVRRDGYSGFGAENKFATFPSVSLAWVSSDEKFFKDNISWLYLKERISWGINGNQGIGRYASFSKMEASNYVYGATSVTTVNPSTLGNSTLKWEETASFNFGIDFGLFNRRINGTIDLYTATTDNVLVQRAIPTTTGYSSVWSNMGQIKNKGMELGITSKNLTGKLYWETNFVFAINKDKISKLYGNENDADIGNSWFVGEPISAIYDYEMSDGTVWTEADLFSGNILNGWYPGQFKLVDQNNDGQIEPNADRKVLGYSAPLYRFSINNTLTYKNFTLSFFINSVQGGKKNYLMNSSYYSLIPAADNAYRMNQYAIRQYWTPDNGVTNASGMYSQPPRTSGLYLSRNFVRLQDVSLSYTLNANLLKKLKISTFQLYIASKNPYIWTKWEGWDPETAIANNDPFRGLTGSMRNITFGCRITL
jgi:TonB-dependent starch-binding outer membrane protein SusC